MAQEKLLRRLERSGAQGNLGPKMNDEQGADYWLDQPGSPKEKILNICRSKPIKTTKLISMINKLYKNKKNLLIKTGIVKGEMLKTHGSNKLLKMNFKPIKFTDIKHGLKEVIFNFKKCL